jgi:hypothetical protein
VRRFNAYTEHVLTKNSAILAYVHANVSDAENPDKAARDIKAYVTATNKSTMFINSFKIKAFMKGQHENHEGRGIEFGRLFCKAPSGAKDKKKVARRRQAVLEKIILHDEAHRPHHAGAPGDVGLPRARLPPARTPAHPPSRTHARTHVCALYAIFYPTSCWAKYFG